MARTTGTKNGDTCFVIMPFGQPFDDYYKQILMPAITSVALIPVRADEINKPGVIIHQIWQGIKDATVCVADVTGRNANVMYELGLAHAVGKPVIQIVQNIEDLPFDLRAYRHILYETRSPRWANSLEERLREMLVAAIANSEPLLPGPATNESTSPRNIVCKRCGTIPGESSTCADFTSHAFISGAGRAFCTRCGADPGGSANCSGFISHEFTFMG